MTKDPLYYWWGCTSNPGAGIIYLRPKPVSVQTTLDPTEALKRMEAWEDVVLKALSHITTRLEKLETASTTRGSQDKFHAPGRGPPPKSQLPTPGKEVTCLQCGRVGHYARGCATKRPSNKPGNGKPPAWWALCWWPRRSPTPSPQVDPSSFL